MKKLMNRSPAKRATLALLGAPFLFLFGCESPYSFSTTVPVKDPPAPANAVQPSTPASVIPSVSGPGTISGNVVDATNKNPLGNAQVKLGSGATTTTDSNGNYSFSNIPAGSYGISFSDSGYIDYQSTANVAGSQGVTVNAALSPVLSSGQLRIVLGWTSQKAGAVRDVDGYLMVPGYNTPIYYANCDRNPANPSFTQCNVTGAYQDVDATQWVGPETITITSQASGTYSYYIANYNNYCDSAALGNSSAVVTVYSGNQVVKQYNVPQGTGVGYHVFDIVNGAITDVNKFMTGLSADTSVNGLIKWTDPGNGLHFYSSSNCGP